jgi:hypothetical protein
VGLWGEDGKPLGPSVVAPPCLTDVWDAELAGPSQLPPGTQVRCIADLEGEAPRVCWLGVDRRRGLHAFLHADGRLPLESTCAGAALARREVARMARAFPWLLPAPGCCVPTVTPDPKPEIAPDLRDMLKDEFGVDVDAMDDDELDFMKG